MIKEVDGNRLRVFNSARLGLVIWFGQNEKSSCDIQTFRAKRRLRDDHQRSGSPERLRQKLVELKGHVQGK